MADLLNFSNSGSRLFARSDPRCMLLLVFIFPIFAFRLPMPVSIALLPVITAGVTHTDLKFKQLIRYSTGFLVIILLLPLTAVMKIFQDTVPSNLLPAVQFSLTLLNVYLFGILIIRSTGIRGITNGITWFSSFIPFVSPGKTGLLIGLTLTLIPQIIVEWKKIRDAQKSRGIEASKNPFRILAAPLFPLLLNTILKSASMAEALESRGLVEKETIPAKDFRKVLHLKWKARDTAYILTAFAALFVLSNPCHLLL